MPTVDVRALGFEPIGTIKADAVDTVMQAAIISQAISLKRIADAQEQIRDHLSSIEMNTRAHT